jgi:membrane fusion protein, multidrug efflux system
MLEVPRLRRILLFTGIVLAAVPLACERRQSAGKGPMQPPEVRTVQAWTAPVERIARSVGQIRAVESVTLASEVAGLVRQIGFEEGALVNQGDLLVELDDSRARAELAAARAARDRASRQVERYEQAATTSAASLTELDTVRTELEQAEALFELARIRVDDHRILAPFAGRVGLRRVSQGAYIQPGDPLTTLTSVDPVEVEFAIPEIFLADLRPGLTLSASSPAYPAQDFTATIDVITPEVEPSTRTVLVLAKAPNSGGVLRPGMFVNVRLVLGTRADAVMVPESALQYQGSQASLYIVEGDQARSRPVRLGERRDSAVEVIEGLRAGEQVVSAGLQKIRDGVKVRVIPDAAVPQGRPSEPPPEGG